jgi:transposase
MAFNVKTTMTWSVRGEDQPRSLEDARNIFLAEAVAAGKTEHKMVPPKSEDGKTAERLWASREAAEEWKTFLENLAEENQVEVSVEISS